MKLKNLPISNDHIVLLGTLGLIAYNTFPKLSLQNEEDSSVFEMSENGEPIAKPKSSKMNYIQKTKALMSMNDYGVLKTLYKMQSVMDDISLFSAPEVITTDLPQGDIMEVIYGIEPYLSNSKKDQFHSITDQIDKTKSTIDKIKKVKETIKNVPAGSGKIDRIKALINEIPNLSGIPLLENLGNIKELTSLLKPLSELSLDSPKKEKTEEEEYNEIYDLVNMIEKKK